LTCILGFVGFATDVGVLLHAKRNLQIAADAAALAGANEIRVSGAGVADIKAAGKAAAAQNGFTDDAVNGTTVNIYPPPVDGPNINKAGYVEAIVTQTQPTIFMRLLKINSIPIAARAVAFNGATTNVGCVRAQDTTGAPTIELQGAFNLDAPGCTVIDNSKDPGALDFTGGSGKNDKGTLSAGYVGVVGTATGKTTDSSPSPVTGIQQTSDPLASQVTAPAPSTWGTCAPPPTGATWGPVKANGIVCYSGTISVGNNVTMNPGVYVFPGTLSFQGNGSLTGTGVTLYIPAGGTLGGGGNGNTTLNLIAPQTTDSKNPGYVSDPNAATYAYNGILIYQDAANTNNISLNGTPIANLTGIIYAPTAELDLSGNTNMTLVADLIVGSLYDKGDATITIKDYTTTFGGPLTTIALVE
jgi:hypothetical protein